MPLWHHRSCSTPLCRPFARHCPSAPIPQRQQNPRIGAVVAPPFMLHPLYRPSGRHCPSTSFPQRQQNPRFTAVVASPFILHPSLQAFWAVLPFYLLSTPAAKPAIRCRCGIAVHSPPLSTGLLRGIVLLPPFHNGSKTHDSLPLWHHRSCSTLSTGLLGGIALLPPFRNGSKTRDSLPLWHHRSCSTLSTGLLGGIALLPPFRNGSKTRDSLPLWKGL